MCAFTYIAAMFLMYNGITGERPNLWLSIIIIIGALIFVIAGMYVMSIVNGVKML
ncbi:MAG: hypothetical protein ACTSR8_07500 [Promethearchaeota archaeon]